MRKNIEKVVQAFKNGRACAGNCSTDGTEIKSYAMVIARKYRGEIQILNRLESPSVTTTKHINQLVESFPEAKIVYSFKD